MLAQTAWIIALVTCGLALLAAIGSGIYAFRHSKRQDTMLSLAIGAIGLFGIIESIAALF